jgi:hypothetical protein
VVAATAAVLRARVSVGRADLPTLLAVGLLDTAGNALFPVASTESLLSVAARSPA